MPTPRVRRIALALLTVLLVTAWLAAHAHASIAITEFDGVSVERDGTPAARAGSHPYSETVSVSLATTPVGGEEVPTEDVKDAVFKFPPGLIANPRAVDFCGTALLFSGKPGCPPESQIGVVTLELLGSGEPTRTRTPLYNLEPQPGTVGMLGFRISGFPVVAVVGLRGDGEYGFTVTTANLPISLLVKGLGVELWGVPADPGHDESRGRCLGSTAASGALCPSGDAADPQAFLTLPTACGGPVRTGVAVTGWLGGADSASFLSHDNTRPLPNPIGAEGCNGVDFSPSFKARPTVNVADSPSGLAADLHLPQHGESDMIAEGHLKQAVITLPDGVSVNPSGANGVDACSRAQIGLTTAAGQTPIRFTAEPAACPDASKLGTAQIDTPLLDHPLTGAVYLATPRENPYGSLLAIYVVAGDEESGTTIKLSGEVELDPRTGQVTASFPESPQLPFDDLRLNINGGAAAPLRTPETCGIYSITSSLTPWSAPYSGPPATPRDFFSIEHSPAGESCPTAIDERPTSPYFDAGTVSPLAGRNSPLVITLGREDGSQQFSSLRVDLPPGLVARLAGIPACPESALAAAAAATGAAEKGEPSCPAVSRIGSLKVAAGAGPAPYYLAGGLYVAGPHAGAQRSVAAVVPIQAGPLDLGTVVLRIAVGLDPSTGRLHLATDPLPRMLAGIPLDLRRLSLSIDRPGLIRNPTSCEPMSVDGSLTYESGAVVPITNRFQVGECARLPFRPTVTVGVTEGAARNGHPSLSTVLHADPEQAALRAAALTFPAGELLDLRRVGALCARLLPAELCPRRSRVGYAKLRSPLLSEDLRGPIYLRAPSHRLPGLLADLGGDGLHVLVHGRTGVGRGGRLRVSFAGLPDIPLSSASFALSGGRDGILVNSEALCGRTRHATAFLTAHNGKRLQLRPRLRLHRRC